MQASILRRLRPSESCCDRGERRGGLGKVDRPRARRHQRAPSRRPHATCKGFHHRGNNFPASGKMPVIQAGMVDLPLVSRARQSGCTAATAATIAGGVRSSGVARTLASQPGAGLRRDMRDGDRQQQADNNRPHPGRDVDRRQQADDGEGYADRQMAGVKLQQRR